MVIRSSGTSAFKFSLGPQGRGIETSFNPPDFLPDPVCAECTEERTRRKLSARPEEEAKQALEGGREGWALTQSQSPPRPQRDIGSVLTYVKGRRRRRAPPVNGVSIPATLGQRWHQEHKMKFK